jgi:hypothetical protein
VHVQVSSLRVSPLTFFKNKQTKTIGTLAVSQGRLRLVTSRQPQEPVTITVRILLLCSIGRTSDCDAALLDFISAALELRLMRVTSGAARIFAMLVSRWRLDAFPD